MPKLFFKNLVLIAQAWFCCNRSSSIEERKEERGGNTKTEEDSGTEAHERLRILRGRAQPSKGVSSPALDLYPTPSYRVKKGKGNEIEMKTIEFKILLVRQYRISSILSLSVQNIRLIEWYLVPDHQEVV